MKGRFSGGVRAIYTDKSPISSRKFKMADFVLTLGNGSQRLFKKYFVYVRV